MRVVKWNSQTKATKGIYELGAGRQMHFDIQTKQLHVEETEETMLVVLEYQLFQQRQLIMLIDVLFTNRRKCTKFKVAII